MASERKNNICFISPFLPYENAGHAGGKYIYDLIKYFKNKFHITLIVRINNDEQRHLNDIKFFCKNVYYTTFDEQNKRNLYGLLKILFSYISLSFFAKKIISKENFYFIQLEYFEMGIFLLNGKANAPIFFNMHDVLSRKEFASYKVHSHTLRGLAHFARFKIVKQFEKYFCIQSDMILVRSLKEKLFLYESKTKTPIIISPIPILRRLDPGTNNYRNNRELIILFVGSLKRTPNKLAVQYTINYILPSVKVKYPNVKFYIIGEFDYIENQTYLKDSSIIFKGFVPDVDKFYKKAIVFISPIRVVGGQNYKNIESMSHGLPVVTSKLGNEGIGGINDEEILIADNATEYSEKIIKLITDHELWNKISRNGIKLIKNNFNRNTIYKELTQVYNNYAS